MTTFHVNALDLKSDRVSLREPKKHDDTYFCRLTYAPGTNPENSGGERQKKLFVKLSGVRFVKHRTVCPVSCSISFKLPSACAQSLMEVEESIVEQTKLHCADWFNQSLTPALIEEYFTSNFAIDRKYGDVFKILVRAHPFGEDPSPMIETHGDALMQLMGVRFHKKQFSLVWALERYDPYVANLEDEDDDDAWRMEDDVDLIDPDVYADMRRSLIQKATAEIDILKDRMTELQKGISELSGGTRCVQVLDKVANLLETPTKLFCGP